MLNPKRCEKTQNKQFILKPMPLVLKCSTYWGTQHFLKLQLLVRRN